MLALGISITGALVARKTESGTAYLQSPGPPPLRFQKNFPLSPYLKQQLFPPKTNGIGNTGAISTDATNQAEIGIYPPTNSLPAASTATTTNNPWDPLEGSSGWSASDLLSVNPQILVEYLKPAQDGTNQNLVVPAEVRFLPPTPGVPPESRAIYKNQ